MKIFTLAIGLAGAAALMPAPADAANCGGAVPCACGDTLVDTRIMTSDDRLLACPLLLHVDGPAAANKTLDCNFRTISCDKGVLSIGLDVANGAHGLTLKNCRIANCSYGIWVKDSNGVNIRTVEFLGDANVGDERQIDIAVERSNDAQILDVVSTFDEGSLSMAGVSLFKAHRARVEGGRFDNYLHSIMVGASDDVVLHTNDIVVFNDAPNLMESGLFVHSNSTFASIWHNVFRILPGAGDYAVYLGNNGVQALDVKAEQNSWRNLAGVPLNNAAIFAAVWDRLDNAILGFVDFLPVW